MNKVSERKDSFYIPLDFNDALSGLLKVNPATMPDRPVVKKRKKVKAKAKKKNAPKRNAVKKPR
jgi:hypothetical protein